MSESEIEQLVQDFLKEVEKKLPEWVKEDKKERRALLYEIEDHIWNKAEELSSSGVANLESVRGALSQMGSPETIANEYKKRGTPKIYITEELWPLFKNVLAIVLFIAILGNIIALIVNIFLQVEDLGTVIGNAVNGILFWMPIGSLIVLGIFTFLSMEGYFPENLKTRDDLKNEKAQLEKGRLLGLPVDKYGNQMKPFIKSGETITGGIIELIIGFIFVIQPFPTTLLHPDFIVLLGVLGIFSIAQGSLDLFRGILGNQNPSMHQAIHGAKIALTFASISIGIILMAHPEIFPILVFESGALVNITIELQFYGLYRGLIGFGIVLVILSTIEDFMKIWKIQKYKI
jgi:uncharacterized membrane protein